MRQFPYDGDLWVAEQTCPVETEDGETVMYTWAAPLSSFRLRGEGENASWGRSIPENRPFRFRWEGGQARDIVCLSGQDGLDARGIVFQGQAMLCDPDRGPAGGWLIPYHTERDPLMFHSRVLIAAGDGVTIERNDMDLYCPPGCLEPALTRLGGDRWLCYMRYGHRGDGFIWRSESSDGGRTFSPPVPTNLRNPHSGIDIATGRSGRLLVAYNDSHSLRTPLTIGISEDEGRTFRTRDVETTAGEFSYPKVYQTRDGVWHLFYTYQRLCIAHVEFEEEWLLGGRKVMRI